MASLYADEQFPLPVVNRLRSLGEDVLTMQETGKANQKIPDAQVLEFASSLERAVLTINRRDFIRLHRINTGHAGIIVCTANSNWQAMADRIHEALTVIGTPASRLIRVNRAFWSVE